MSKYIICLGFLLSSDSEDKSDAMSSHMDWVCLDFLFYDDPCPSRGQCKVVHLIHLFILQTL